MLDTTGSIQLTNQLVPYQLKRSGRKSIGLSVKDKRLAIYAPLGVPIQTIHHIILEKERWILRQLQNQEHVQSNTPIVWENGMRLLFLGKNITLFFQSKEKTYWNDDMTDLHIYIAPNRQEKAYKNDTITWLKEAAHRHFQVCLDYFSPQVGVHYNGFSLSHATTRWGSCNHLAHIRLSWRLIHLPPYLIDYVVVHELAHILQMNHSPHFWAIVEKILPDYKKIRAELRKQSITSFFNQP